MGKFWEVRKSLIIANISHGGPVFAIIVVVKKTDVDKAWLQKLVVVNQ